MPELLHGESVLVRQDGLSMTDDELREQKTQLIAYLLSKVKSCDWHAVMDVAVDIREIEARLEDRRSR